MKMWAALVDEETRKGANDRQTKVRAGSVALVNVEIVS